MKKYLLTAVLILIGSLALGTFSLVFVTAGALPLRSGSSGGASYADDERGALRDLLFMINLSGATSDPELTSTDEIYVRKNDGEYYATVYYSGKTTKYRLTGDLTGEIQLINGYFLMPNNYLYDFNSFEMKERMMDDWGATGIVSTIKWPVAAVELEAYQKPFVSLAARYRAFVQQSDLSWLKNQRTVTAVTIAMMVCLVVFAGFMVTTSTVAFLKFRK